MPKRHHQDLEEKTFGTEDCNQKVVSRKTVSVTGKVGMHITNTLSTGTNKTKYDANLAGIAHTHFSCLVYIRFGRLVTRCQEAFYSCGEGFEQLAYEVMTFHICVLSVECIGLASFN